MSTYTTGEFAKLGRVSVRTIQYYDQKGILNPTTISEGGPGQGDNLGRMIKGNYLID